jgi:tetratricopeptide (TPR) repeat protein
MKWIAAFAVGVCIFLVPSSIRHQAYFQTLSPFAAHGGFNFYIGNNPEAEGVFMSPSGISSNPVSQIKTSIRVASREVGKDLTPYEASAYWLRKGLSYLASHPIDAAGLYLKKIFLFFRKEEASLNIDYALSRDLVPLFKAPFLSYGAIAPLCLIGLILALRRADDTRVLLVSYYAVSAASIMVFFISDRYRLPSVPFAILFAAFCVTEVVKYLGSRRFGSAGASLAAAGACFFLVHYDFEALTANSVTGTHYNNLGTLYIRQGAPEKALEALRKAIELDPGLAAAHNNLGQLHIERKELETGIRHLNRALQLDPEYAVAHYNMGMALEKLGKPEEAKERYARAVDLSPHLAEARVNLATLLM